MMEEMWEIAQKVKQPVTFPARVGLLSTSWLEYKWLLEKDPDRFSVTVRAPEGVADSWEGASEYDLLTCRNDYNKKAIYYALSGEKFDRFRALSITAGSPLNHFPDMVHRDGVKVTWAHGVNSQQHLKDALEGKA